MESDDIRLLVLMRHAKSDWSDETLSDHDRPLNERGTRAAPRMADWLCEVRAVPDLILCSSAVRTRQTVSLMVPQWETEPEVSYEESLYLSSPETMLGMVAALGRDHRVVMVVAHNPGTSHLVSVLADKFTDMPTAAIAIFKYKLTDWSEVESQPSELVTQMRPKAL